MPPSKDQEKGFRWSLQTFVLPSLTLLPPTTQQAQSAP